MNETERIHDAETGDCLGWLAFEPDNAAYVFRVAGGPNGMHRLPIASGKSRLDVLAQIDDQQWRHARMHMNANKEKPLTMTEQAAMTPPVTYPEESFKRDCEAISKLVADGVFFLEPANKKDPQP